MLKKTWIGLRQGWNERTN